MYLLVPCEQLHIQDPDPSDPVAWNCSAIIASFPSLVCFRYPLPSDPTDPNTSDPWNCSAIIAGFPSLVCFRYPLPSDPTDPSDPIAWNRAS